MSNIIDLTGRKFSHLTVLERVESGRPGLVIWKCQCDCGNITYVRSSNLKSGQVRSCGASEHLREWAYRTHSMSNTPLYRKWIGIRRRCYDPKCRSYGRYGGRGIKMCDEWRDSFEAFAKWVEATRTSDDLTIERIDYNGDYCPENCTWADRKAQANNRSYCRMFTYNGKTQNLTQWCEELNLEYKRVHNRIFQLNWSFEKAISAPVNENKKNLVYRQKRGD